MRAKVMVKQPVKPETSSVNSEVRSKAREMFEKLPDKEKRRAIDDGFRAEMQRLLVALVNLHDEGQEQFWASKKNLWTQWFGRESKVDLLELRDQIRRLWDRQTYIADKDRILMKWLQPRGETPAIIARFQKGAIQPNPFNLRALLAFAIVERAAKLAHCHNPGCPVPYFVAKRKDQKYCERGDCTAYAQRQYALDWWKREHSSGKKKRGTKS
jgi:hypothetical protein